MTIQDFEKELKLINKDLSIRPNNAPARVVEMFPDVNNLASVLYCGVELFTIPNHEIFDEKSGSYGIDLRQNGKFIPHRTRPEALSMLADKMNQLKDKEFSDQFFGRGDYSDAALMRKEAPTPELVEEVSVDAKPVEGGMLEGAHVEISFGGEQKESTRLILEEVDREAK